MENDVQIIDSIKKFGNTFQSKTIASLLIDKYFLEQIIDILSAEFYDSPANKWIVETIMAYFIEYKAMPSMDVFKVKLDTVEDAVLKTSIVDHLKSAFTNTKADDLQFVKNQFLEFCKNQKLKSAIVESVDLLKVGKYDSIKHLVDTALKAGVERNLGHDYINDFEHRMSESARHTVATGMPLIDELMDGGLGKGELGIVIGSAGGGKCIGSNTEIEIRYHEIGVEFIGNTGKPYTIWISPFNKYKIDDMELYGWQVENFIWELQNIKQNEVWKIDCKNNKEECVKIIEEYLYA